MSKTQNSIFKLAEYFSFRTKLADATSSSFSTQNKIIFPQAFPSQYRLVNLNDYKRVNDEVLDCYIFIVNTETNKPIWFKKAQITNETLPQIKSLTQTLLQKFLQEDIVGEAKILINTKSTWSTEIEAEI